MVSPLRLGHNPPMPLAPHEPATADPPAPPEATMRRFGLTDAAFAARTPIADVWKATRADGGPAALKIWRGGDMRNEAAGLDCLAAWAGRGAVRLIDRDGAAALMEWAPGPPLGDLFRAGDWRTADKALVETTLALHALAPAPPESAPPLRAFVAALFDARPPGDWPDREAAVLRAAQGLGESLLASAPAPVLLHGDMHHDNIAGSERGWLAFDPKGVVGEPAYDFANAFRNPRGGGEAMLAEARIMALADQVSAALGIAPARMLDWAAAKATLSLIWSRTWEIEAARPKLAMVERFLRLAEARRDGGADGRR